MKAGDLFSIIPVIQVGFSSIDSLMKLCSLHLMLFITASARNVRNLSFHFFQSMEEESSRYSKRLVSFSFTQQLLCALYCCLGNVCM